VVQTNLQAYREARKLSQEAIARRLGLSQSHYSKIERGAVVPSVLAALRVARELDCTVAQAWPLPAEIEPDDPAQGCLPLGVE
jgi:transcriptional regulator with XRE-family HTH domain